MNLMSIANAYVRRIKRNEITIEDVPEQIVDLVRSIVQEDQEE